MVGEFGSDTGEETLLAASFSNVSLVLKIRKFGRLAEGDFHRGDDRWICEKAVDNRHRAAVTTDTDFGHANAHHDI